MVKSGGGEHGENQKILGKPEKLVGKFAFILQERPVEGIGEETEKLVRERNSEGTKDESGRNLKKWVEPATNWDLGEGTELI